MGGHVNRCESDRVGYICIRNNAPMGLKFPARSLSSSVPLFSHYSPACLKISIMAAFETTNLSAIRSGEQLHLLDEVFDLLKAKTNNAAILSHDVHALVRDLHCLLDVVETAVSHPTCPNSGLEFHEQLSLWQEEVDWRRCKTQFVEDNGYCN
jgi:hypothetical protein